MLDSRGLFGRRSCSRGPALRELEQGGKRTLWVGWTFPQLASLGISPQAQRFGLDGLDEAGGHLGDDVVVVRLVTCSGSSETLRAPSWR